MLIGQAQSNTVAFLGIPYAAPPIGKLRWRPPQPAQPWRGERRANKFSASCQQVLVPEGYGPWTSEYVVSGEVNEDCLYLNVWTAAKSAAERLPVMLWIHGGGFFQGSTSVPIYDGSAVAAKGIVVVTINYRLGAYGFLAHPELTAESASRASGNYGLMDMVAALRWVRDNIAAFGGDPTQVTVAGQAAGALAVHYLIASPSASGLFVRAIAQSGLGMGSVVPDLRDAEAIGHALVKASGGTRIIHLRQLSARALNAVIIRSGGQPLRFRPTVDGAFLPSRAYVDANTNDVPVLAGITASEITAFDQDFDQITAGSFREQLRSEYEPVASDLAALYPAGDDAAALEASLELARDRGLATLYTWAANRMKKSKQPIFGYLWSHVEPGPDSGRYRAFHSSEIPYIFDTLDRAPERAFTARDRELAELSSSYWANWVKHGDPNGRGLPVWPRLETGNKRILEIGTAAIHQRPVLSDDRLEVFEKHIAAGGRLGIF